MWHDGHNKQEISSFGGVFKLEYDFGSTTLTSITGYESLDDMYSRGDIDGGYGAAFLGEGNYGPGFIPFPSESADGLPFLDQWTQEFRLASNDNEVAQLAGRLLLLQRGTAGRHLQLRHTRTGQSPGRLRLPDPGRHVLRPLRLGRLAGGSGLGPRRPASASRATKRTSRPNGPTRPSRHPTVRPITEHVEDDVVSWDLSALYKVNQNVNLYGRVATGYRAPSIQGRILFCADFEGGLNPATNCVTVADTETILSFEVGIKTILAENKLRFNLTGYIFEIDDQQVTAVGGEYNTATLLNADKTEGYGLETDIEWTPTGHWLMTFGASWNPTEIKDPNLTVAPCGGGCTVTDPVVDGLAYVDGNSLPHAPDVIFNGIINWRSDPAKKKLLRNPRLGLLLGEELLPLRVGGVQRRRPRIRSAAGLRLQQRQVRGRAVRAQHLRRGDRPRRHRLQQPDRFHERSQDHRRRVPRPLLIHIRTHNQGRPSGRPFSLEFNSQRLNDAVSRITAILKVGQGPPYVGPTHLVGS